MLGGAVYVCVIPMWYIISLSIFVISCTVTYGVNSGKIYDCNLDILTVVWDDC